MEKHKRTEFFHRMGGRKQFNGYVATLLLTAMAPILQASFSEYSLGLLGALGLTSGLIALEDRDEKRYSAQIKMNETKTGAPPLALGVTSARGSEPLDGKHLMGEPGKVRASVGSDSG
jgi:hypothetical protein